MSHANARLTPHGTLLLVQRVCGQGRPIAHVARELGISRQCVHRWVARFDAEGAAGLIEQSSRPHRCGRTTPPQQVARVLAARAATRCGPEELARATGFPPARSRGSHPGHRMGNRQVYRSNDERTLAFTTWIHLYNTERHHCAVGAAPITRLSPT